MFPYMSAIGQMGARPGKLLLILSLARFGIGVDCLESVEAGEDIAQQSCEPELESGPLNPVNLRKPFDVRTVELHTRFSQDTISARVERWYISESIQTQISRVSQLPSDSEIPQNLFRSVVGDIRHLRISERMDGRE